MSTEDIMLIKRISRYEKKFAKNKYNGSGDKEFQIKEGSIPVMVSAPHSVNQYREGQEKFADRFTGAIAEYLCKKTGCHIIYSTKNKKKDPNFDSNLNGENLYQTKLKDYIGSHKVNILIDLHGASEKRGYAVEMGTAPIRNETKDIIGDPDPSLHGKNFIVDLIKYTFDFVLRDLDLPQEKKQVCKNQIFDAGSQNTITKFISENTNTSCIQLEINGVYRNPQKAKEFIKLIEALSYIINILGKIDWNATKVKVFRLWQSSSHKPQDKVEIDVFSENNSHFSEDCPLSICSFGGGPEMVKLQNTNKCLKDQLFDHITNSGYSSDGSDYIFLTNRLIELVCGREWIMDKEKIPLCDAPIVLYENVKNIYSIGMPKANQIDNVTFSSKLFEEKKEFANDYNFAIYNRYTDSKFYIDFNKADYMDYYRVKDANGQPTKKIMIPRYYRRLLGYLDEPLTMMRKIEYVRLVNKTLNHYLASFLKRIYLLGKDGQFELQETILKKEKIYLIITQLHISVEFSSSLTNDRYNLLLKKLHDSICVLFSNCYEEMIGEDFYKLRNKSSLNLEYLNTVAEIQKILGIYNYIELLQIPQKTNKSTNLYKNGTILFDKLFLKFLNSIIGKSEYFLKTEWTSETDDKNNVARLSSNIMSLLGVAENDKILIKFGDNMEILRVLANNDFSDYQIGIPAPARKKLGMNSVNDIVLVHRDMKHTFWRNSQAQIIAILGTILAVFQVATDIAVGIIICLIFIPLIIILVLNEERIKVK